MCSTMFRVRLSRYWRSCPNRRLSHGWRDTEAQNEGSASSEVKDDLSRFLREAETQDVVITRHGKPAGVLIGFKSEDDWFDYRLEHDPRFLQRVEQARPSFRAGRGVKLEDIK